MDRDDQPAAAGVIAVLAKKNALPGAQTRFSALDGNRKRTAQQRRLHMGRHIVGALAGVPMGEILGGDGRQRAFEIQGDIRVGVLVDRERGRRVLDENVHQAGSDLAKLWQSGQDLVGHQMEAGGQGREFDDTLNPGHFRW